MSERAQKEKNCGTPMGIPRPLPREVARESLLAEMEQCREEVVVLQAGAGCGKTALLAALARRKRGHCEWIWTDDNDTQKAYHRILSFLLASAESRAEKRTCYVFMDECERVRAEDFCDGLRRLIECGWAKIFLSIRGELPLFLSRYLIQGKVRIFDAERLFFSRQETGALLRGIIEEDQPEHIVERVQAYTGGWPAGVAFVGLEMKNRTSMKERFSQFKCSLLHNYIYYEIFQGLSNDIQTFLVESAVLGEMETELCDYALERSDSEQMLAMIFRIIPFFLGSAQKLKGIVYLPVFEKFLRERIDPLRRKRILERLVKYEKGSSGEEKENIFLEVRCLGCLDVVGAKGKIVWRTKKTKELFACLFFEEGRGIRKEVLLERLWPDTGGKQANALFYTTVTYLRKALMTVDAGQLLVVENQTYRLDTVHITSDYQVLMKWNQWAKKGELPLIRETLEVVELYRECYMCGEDYLWLGAQREYVEQIFLQTVGKLAKMEMEREKYEKAVLLLEKAVEIDSYEISLLELLVECLLSQGNVGTAKKYFGRLRRVCQEELHQKNVLHFRDYIIKAEKRNARRDV